MIKVPRQLPVNEMMVFMIMTLLPYGDTGKTPALKDGQNIHKNSVPIIAKMLEL